MRHDNLISDIVDAFSDHRYDDTVDSELRGLLNSQSTSDEFRECYQDFIGKEWEDIPQAVFERYYASGLTLTGDVFRFYLPAFLLAAIRSRNDTLTRLLFAARLRPPRKVKPLTDFRRTFDPLTPPQASAVVDFLNWASQDRCRGDARFKRQVIGALDNYWQRRAGETPG